MTDSPTKRGTRSPLRSAGALSAVGRNKEEQMKLKLPIGLKVLAILYILCFVMVLAALSKQKDHMIFVGQIVGGVTYAIYYGGISMAYGVMGIGLLKQQKWAYMGLFILNGWDILMSLANILATTHATLIESGWKLQDSMMPFYGIQAFRIVLCLLILFWLSRYKRYFRSDKQDKPNANTPLEPSR